MGSILEISNPVRKIMVSQGYLQLHYEDHVKDVPLDLIDSILILPSSYGAAVSFHALNRLISNGSIVIACDDHFNPNAITSRYSQEGVRSRNLRAQIQSTDSLSGFLWKKIVQEKIRQQSTVLENQKHNNVLTSLISRVRIHDPSNIEARAARIYWSTLFGSDFRRDRYVEGTNTFLNYGYTVLRSAIVRSLSGHGLNPTIGLKHCGISNNFALADDLIEPFRPLVDREVLRLREATTLTSEIKRILVAVLEERLIYGSEAVTTRETIDRTVESLVRSYRDKDRRQFNASYEVDD